MEEKAKSKVLIYIIVVLVAIIVLLSIGGIHLYKELSKQENNNQVQDEVKQEEKQVDKEIQIVNDKVAKQNILVNGKVVEVKETITGIKKDDNYTNTYIISTKVEINGVETEKVEELSTLVEKESDIKASNTYGNITTIKGEDNKDYILIVLCDTADYYYILNENGEIIGNFENNLFDGVKFEKDNEEYEDYVQIKDNYIIEYEDGRRTDYEGFDNGAVLKKWKITIKDNKLIRELLDTYTEDEIETKR